MGGVPFYVVDAFTDQAFRGNPAAVCILNSFLDFSDDWLQNVAAEVNLSETAFVDFGNRSLRWFTPVAEVDLCGHATVAAAKALLDIGLLQTNERLEFKTRSGLLSAELVKPDRVQLDFPTTPPTPGGLCDAIQANFPSAVYYGRSRFDALIELETQEQVQALKPDFASLGELDYRGVIVTAKSDEPQFDFVSRFFAPALSVEEYPVTGSAHCCLGPYWGQKLGKVEMSAVQLSQRGGKIDLKLENDRVKLIGNAVMVVKGTLFPDADP
ncbi:MAG: PhzF family phenazine biosynthesis isomerase [Planctomycetota bacterium]|nr:PhzF family phenazine biosynthesis isomerase [Planctomycetota bacterium]